MNELATKNDIKDFEIDWNVYLQNFLIAQSGLSKKTVNAYRTGVRQFIAYLEMNEIDRPLPDDIHHYQAYLKEKGYSVFTRGLYMISLKKFFSYLNAPYKDTEIKVYQDIYSMANPKVQRPARVHYKEMPTDEAIERLRRQLRNKRSQKSKRDLLMIDLALYCGLRVNEVANVKTTDLVKEGEKYRLYVLRKGYDAKTNSVFVAEDIVKRIKNYISKYKINGYVFTDISHLQTKGHLSSCTVSNIITNYMKQAEIKNDRITAHSLRHYAGTIYYQLTHDLYATQQFMGHRDSKTTELYMHVDKNYERNAIALQPA